MLGSIALYNRSKWSIQILIKDVYVPKHLKNNNRLQLAIYCTVNNILKEK